MRCEETYIRAQYCTTSYCTTEEIGKLYRIEHADYFNHGICSVTYLCRC